jgi:hypothetical protein
MAKGTTGMYSGDVDSMVRYGGEASLEFAFLACSSPWSFKPARSIREAKLGLSRLA